MELQNFFAQDVNGNIVPGAVCSLFLPGTATLAAGLQDINNVPMGNPFNADANALVQFRAPNGVYDLHIAAGALSNTLQITCADNLQALAELASFLGTHPTAPTVRTDSTPLQLGDRYFNSSDDLEYLYKSTGWEPNNLDGALIAAPGGAGLVGTLGRTQADKNLEFTTVRDFSNGKPLGLPVPDCLLSEFYDTLADAQAQYANITITSLGQTVDWASTESALKSCGITGRTLYQGAGTFRMLDGLTYYGSHRWQGDGFYADVNQSAPFDLKFVGTNIVAVGTGAKIRYAYGVTDERTSGGRLINKEPAFGATDAYLSLASYYNEDATSTVSATAKPFSALVYMPRGSCGGRMADIRLVLNFNGLQGYKDKVLTLADDWDVALYVDNGRYNEFHNIQAYGYWRLNGFLTRAGALAWETSVDGIYAGAEENKWLNCVAQGWKSFSIRGVGMYRCMAVTSTYIEIPYAANHPFDIVKDPRIVRGEFTPRTISVTSMSQVGSNLRFMTATDQTAFVVVGQEILPAYVGNGVAGTVAENCRMHAMWHTSDRRISDPAITGAMAPAACLEVSGARVRGPRFQACKLQTVDDIGPHLHQTIDVIFNPNARFEGATPSANAAGGGIRCITTPASGDVNYPGRCRETFRVQLHMEQNGGDFTPQFGTLPTKFTQTGYWFPNIGSMIFQAGVIIGPDTPDAAHLLKEYVEGGYTSAWGLTTPGDLVVNNVARGGTSQIIGNWVNVNAFNSSRMTFTTGSGNLTFALPQPLVNQSNLRAILNVSYEGLTLPAGRTQLHLEILPGTNIGTFVASGSGLTKATLTSANIVSGAFVVATITGGYKFR